MTHDPFDQLELLNHHCSKLGPYIYRDHALYLQTLRSLLLVSVRQAIFVLINDHGQNNFSSLPSKTREEFQLKVEDLVKRCSSLLTIEQLMELVHQIEKEKKKKQESAKKQMLEVLNTDIQRIEEPEGSIYLSSSLPVNNSPSLGGWMEPDYNSLELNVEGGSLTDLDCDQKKDVTNNLSKQSNDSSELDKTNAESQKNDLEVLRSLFDMAGEAMKSDERFAPRKDSLLQEDLDHQDQGLFTSDGFLPGNPIDLYHWIDSFELALTRRLRNLSHALNIELLRIGISHSLLPVSLLDAVLLSQIDAQHSASNVFKLRLPFSNSALDGEMDISFLLFRVSELEFDDFKLRQCRSQLKQYRLRLIKMVKQQRHWHGRLLAKEAYQKWWKTP